MGLSRENCYQKKTIQRKSVTGPQTLVSSVFWLVDLPSVVVLVEFITAGAALL